MALLTVQTLHMSLPAFLVPTLWKHINNITDTKEKNNNLG